MQKCKQYSINNVTSYITAFYCVVSHVGITDDKILDRFVIGLKPKILENSYCFHKQIPLKRPVLLLKEWVLYF